MTDLSSLIERLAKATGPNYSLEIDIFKFFNPDYRDYVEGRGGLVHKNDGEDQRVLSNVRPPNVTASIDAAVALAVRVLPGVELELTNLYGVARVTLHHEMGPFYGSSAINSLPMALVLATLSYLQSKGPEA